MNKIAAVIKREYISIVKTKSFIVMTILTPLLLLLFMTLPFLMTFIKSGTTHIAVLDETGLFINKIEGNNQITLTFISGEFDDYRLNFSHEYDGFLHIPNFDLQYPNGIRLFTEKQIGISTNSFIERQIENIIENVRFEREGIDKAMIEKLKVDIRIESIIISGEEERSGSALISLILGYIMGFAQYFIIFIYGSMVMKSIMDEKRNRIVEILVSSIRPFELMLGKILGIASVAITQLGIWLAFFGIVFTIFTFGVLPFIETNYINTEVPTDFQNNTLAMNMVEFAQNPGQIMNVGFLIFAFAFYFVFGYLFYSTLFSASGAISDDDNQSQILTFPISMIVIVSLMLMTHVVDNPHSPIALWASIIPFSSPIVMLARIPFNVPAWQIIVSMFTIIISFLGMIWLSGKIFRMGILLYGKKLTWKDLWKFIRV